MERDRREKWRRRIDHPRVSRSLLSEPRSHLLLDHGDHPPHPRRAERPVDRQLGIAPRDDRTRRGRGHAHPRPFECPRDRIGRGDPEAQRRVVRELKESFWGQATDEPGARHARLHGSLPSWRAQVRVLFRGEFVWIQSRLPVFRRSAAESRHAGDAQYDPQHRACQWIGQRDHRPAGARKRRRARADDPRVDVQLRAAQRRGA